MNSYLVIAYMILWLIIFIYLFGIDLRQKTLQREIENLKNELDVK